MLSCPTSSWQYPKIPGLDQYKGKLMHSAKWDATYDLKGKTVAVVGGGSSAVQLVPSIQPSGSKMNRLHIPMDPFLTSECSRWEIDPIPKITSVDHDRFRRQICRAWRHKFLVSASTRTQPILPRYCS